MGSPMIAPGSVVNKGDGIVALYLDAGEKQKDDDTTFFNIIGGFPLAGFLFGIHVVCKKKATHALPMVAIPFSGALIGAALVPFVVFGELAGFVTWFVCIGLGVGGSRVLK